jgi:hypothetical protein
MHHVSQIPESIQRMGSSDIYTADISEQLHIANVKEVYRYTNNVDSIRQKLKHKDHMEQTISYLEL